MVHQRVEYQPPYLTRVTRQSRDCALVAQSLSRPVDLNPPKLEGRIFGRAHDDVIVERMKCDINDTRLMLLK